jgi:lysozyme
MTELHEMSTRQLLGDEGKRSCVYNDSLGFATIGVGRLVDKRKPGAGLRDVEIVFMLQNDVNDRVDALQKAFQWFAELNTARQGVLVNMSFQLGMEGLMGFKNTLRMIASKDFEGAATGLMKSVWATQTPQRAQRLAQQMLTGEWVFEAGV